MVLVLVVGSLASGVGGVQVAGDETEDWSTFSHDNRNSGHNSNTTGPISNVTKRWNVTVSGHVGSSPVVANGTVYIGSHDNNVYAFDTAAGTERWNFTTGNWVSTAPAVANGTVYVGSIDHNVYALNASDGTEQWNSTIGSVTDSSPAIADGVVYVSDWDLYALDAVDGTERWNFTDSGDVRSSPAVVGDTVYVGSSDHKIYALNASNGAERWNFTTGDSIESSPAVVDGVVYVGSDDHNVYALNASDGTKRWNVSVGDTVVSSPAVGSDTVYVGNDHGVFALDIVDGTERWSFTSGGSVIDSSPALVSDTVYIGSYNNNVYALNASDGTVRWSYATDGFVASSPAVADGTVYIRSNDGNLYALEGDTPGDSAPPQLVESTPGDDETDVTTGTDVRLRFDEPVQAGSGQFYLNATDDDTVLDTVAIGSSDVKFDGANVTWTRTDALPPGTDVYLYVPGGVIEDAAGNPWLGLQDATTFNFATGTGDWSSFSYNARNTGHNPHTTGPVSSITKRWNVSTGDSVLSSPAVSDGTLYIGSDDGHVYALDVTDGSERWNFTTGDDVFSSPTVADGTVYVGSDDDNLYALNATDGSERWNFTNPFLSRFLSSPAVVNDTVYIGGTAGVVYAIHASDGTERWRFETGNLIRSSPAVADGIVYVGSVDHHVYALDAADGTEEWRFTTGGDVLSSPAVVDNSVYVGSTDNHVYALDATTGTERWRFATSHHVDASPAVANGIVYAGSLDHNVYALDAADGTEEWRFMTDGPVASSPAVVNNSVYVGSTDDHVYALDASDGTKQWNFSTGGSVHSSPAVVDGVAYVGSIDGKVYALEEVSPEDSAPPQLVDSTPSTGETDVRTDTDVTLEFDEPVQAGSGELYLNRTSDDAVLDSGAVGSSDVTFDGTDVMWSRTSELPTGTDVYLYVPGGVIEDVAGNPWQGIQDATTLDFATGTGDWPSFSYDNRNSGHNPHTVGPVSNVTELWNTSVGIGVESSPAVVDGTLYVGSTDDNVYALNASDGSVRWNFSADQNIDSSPAVVDNTVYIGSWDKRLYALNASDGTERWNFTTNFVVRSSPKVVDDTVYIGTMASDGRIYALNASDGSERWHFDSESSILSTPAVVDETVYFGNFNDFASFLGGMVALNSTDGNKRWENTLGSNVRSSPAVVDGVVYVGAYDGKVYALDAADGSERWNYTTDGGIENSPAVGNDTVYVGSSDGKLYALNATDGSERWNFNAEIGVDSAPALANGVVYFGTGDRTVYALDAATGAHQWNITTSDSIRSSPAIVDGVVYVSTRSAVHGLGGELPTDVTDSESSIPELSNFSVQVVDTRTITVSFDSNESLDTIEVEVESQAGTVEETLTVADFGSFGTDPVEYFAQTSLPSAGIYTVTLTTAADAAGNDGASGENTTVQLVVEDVSIEHVNGTAPNMANLTSNVYLSQGPGGLLQVQLRDGSDPTADVVNRTDLENLGVESDTTLAINVTLVDWTPRLLLGTGHDLSWTTTDLGANVTALNLTVRPAETQLIESQLFNPDEPWPTGANDRADVRMNASVDLAVDDMEHLVDPGQRDAVDGTILATDAQAFGTPRYDGETNTLSLFVAGPHLSVDGENHTGFYDAFLPDALLDEWGVEDASELTVAYQGDPIDFAAQNVDGGIQLMIDLTYSAGEVAISATDAGSDTEPEPAPEPAPPSASDPDPVSEPDDESEQTKTVEVDDTEDNVTVRKTVAAGNASANTTVSLDVSVEPEDDPENATEEHPVTLDGLNVTMNRTADVSLTITESAEPPTEDSATFERTDGTALLGYIRIDHDLDDEDVGEVELEFRVRKALLDEAGDDPEHVALYRLEGDEWAELPTDLIGETDTHYVFLAISPGLSEFATGAKRAKFEIANAQVSVTELHTGDDFEVLVRITNIGGVDGTYTAELWIDGDLRADQDVTVAANGTRQLTFDHDFETPGSYEVRVNDLSTGQIQVLAVTATPSGANPATASAGTPGGTETAPQEGGSTVSLPGFGMVVALVAVLFVSLIAGRRRS